MNNIKKTYKNKDRSINHQKLNKLRDKELQRLVNLHDKVNVKEIGLDYRNENYRKIWNLILELTNEKESLK